MLFNGDLTHIRESAYSGEAPLLWTLSIGMQLETEPQILGLPTQHCPVSVPGEPTRCLAAHSGWHTMSCNVFLNDTLLEDPDSGDYDLYAETELRKSGYDFFESPTQEIAPSLLVVAPALLLTVWVAGREDWKGGFGLQMQVMGAKKKRRRGSAYDPKELMTVMTKQVGFSILYLFLRRPRLQIQLLHTHLHPGP